MNFKDLNIAEMDRNLSVQERSEWQSIYASYRSGSVMTGSVVGVDEHIFKTVPEGKTRAVRRTVRCLIVIPYRVKIIIPDNEIFLDEGEFQPPVIQSICGADISFIVTAVDRENGVAVASRKQALEQIRRVNARRRITEGQVVEVDIISVGRDVCTASYRGYDVLLAQRDISHTLITDLRDFIRPGEKRRAVVKAFNREENMLKLSIKDTMPHPFDGVETRHPIGCTRIATIVGKYAGGVYCRLYDGVTDVLCSYATMQFDGDYVVGDSVEILIRKYNYERKVIFGKVLRKKYAK